MQTIAKGCNVVESNNIAADLNLLLAPYAPSQVFLLTDQGSQQHCLNALLGVEKISTHRTFTIASGDENKNYNTAVNIWNFLSHNGATRNAILINLGGGMPCDLGGFCAATFKRGIDFINIPTTLLAQVDASLGGKTGMNLENLKNEIGVFAPAKTVMISSLFLRSLDHQNLLSGFAEMLKHALIFAPEELKRLMKFDLRTPDFNELQTLVCNSIAIKNHFVESDPKELGIRKALNFGHTFGHAFETYSMRQPTNHLLHGCAVAHGIVCELLLSRQLLGLDIATVDQINSYILSTYGKLSISQADFAPLVELMKHDKKNDTRGINFTLLPQIGEIAINQIATPPDIEKTLSEYIALAQHI